MLSSKEGVPKSNSGMKMEPDPNIFYNRKIWEEGICLEDSSNSSLSTTMCWKMSDLFPFKKYLTTVRPKAT